MPKEQYVLVVGNPVEGIILIGPFESAMEAARQGEKEHADTEFWITPLCPVLETVQ